MNLLVALVAVEHDFYLVNYIAVHSITGNLASTYYERGQADMAILYYKQAIGCDPRFLEAYNNLVSFVLFCFIGF